MPMDTSHEVIFEPETYIGDAINTDRMNHDEMMEITTPVNKAPSVIPSEDKTPTPILKVGNSGTTVMKRDPAAFNTMCQKGKKVGHFATRCNRDTLRGVWEKKSLHQPVSKKTTGVCRSLHDC